jgi:hypothetical protein
MIQGVCPSSGSHLLQDDLVLVTLLLRILVALKRHIGRETATELLVDIKAEDRGLEVPTDGHCPLHQLVGLRSVDVGRVACPDGDTVAESLAGRGRPRAGTLTRQDERRQ